MTDYPAANAPLLDVTNLQHTFQTGAGRVFAVNGVSFRIDAGEAVGLVGESGSGKSTVAKCLVRLLEPSGGSMRFRGADITHMNERSFRPLRSQIQMVFQDPTMSLNPRLTVRQTLSEPLRLHKTATNGNLEARLHDLMGLVNLDRRLLGRQPHQLSGGQKQRVGIARAIATNPAFVVLDEPTASLDMSIRIQIISLLRRLQDELGMTYLFISHDLSTVRHLCNRVIVMYLGQVVEEGPVEEIFTNPKHPYTQALLSAVPIPDPARRGQRRRIVLPGETPHLTAPIVGCPLADRCPYVMPACRQGTIPFFDIEPGGHRAACLLYAEDRDAVAIDGSAESARVSRSEASGRTGSD
ncbi:MAG: ABC transporter ATP-binding protein [Thermomicrobiales bacterium]|nr:ABC transporter ATP-binding protein [Thermomicrobiales bacterium]